MNIFHYIQILENAILDLKYVIESDGKNPSGHNALAQVYYEVRLARVLTLDFRSYNE